MTLPQVSPLGATAAAGNGTAEGERKQVTVLFADVARSMDLAEQLGADELCRVMSGLFEVCREAVEHFGGTVDKFTGDGVMALFGAPVAQEDHARRACYAALRLVEATTAYGLTLRQRRIDLAVRVGLNSGEVVAGSVGGGSYTAVGHTVGLAQRMEALAEPGAAYLSEHTARLIGEDFLLRSLGRVEVKGSTFPLGVFALERAAGGTATPGRRRSGSARLVGRDRELATLEESLAEAREGRAQVFGLVAEAGAGKSRLCDELAARAAAAGVLVRRTAGVSHAQTVPLLPILGLFRDYFAVAAEDSPGEIRAKVRARVLGLDSDLDPELGLIFDFLEVPDPDCPAPQLGPDARRRRVLDVIRRLTQRRSKRETLLLILEDLHWFDPQSVAFLDAWFPSFPGTRTLLVTNFRPEFHAPWMARSYYRQLPLAPLDAVSVGELLAELLGPDQRLSSVSRQLLARAGGNPFFAEEIVRGLAGDGTLVGEPGAYSLARPASEVRVPPSVQAVLAARIDRLAQREKAVLQAASVIGRRFSQPILSAVSGVGGGPLGEILQSLCAAELLQSTGTAGEYRFWHPLTQEVAYGTLVAATRSRHHAAVAGALIAAGVDRHDELAALIATHYEAAADGLEAARWQIRAATRAFRSNVAEVQRLARLAIGFLDAVPETAESLTLGVQARTLILRAGARDGIDVDEADLLLAEARPVAERLAALDLLFGLANAEGSLRLSRGDVPGGLAGFRAAGRHADQTNDAGLRAPARLGLALTLQYAGPVTTGLHAIDELLDLCDDDPSAGADTFGFTVTDTACTYQAILLMLGGRLDESRAAAKRALAGFTERPMAEWHSWNLAHSAHLADCTGEDSDVQHASPAADRALQLARDSGNTTAAIRAMLSVAIVALLHAHPDEAAATLEAALVEARENHCLVDEAGLLTHLALAYLALADRSRARDTGRIAVAVARRHGAKIIECRAQLVCARIWRETVAGEADLAEARAFVTAGELSAHESGAVTYAAFLAEERARLDDDVTSGRAALKACADGYDAIGATGHARRLRAELAS